MEILHKPKEHLTLKPPVDSLAICGLSRQWLGSIVEAVEKVLEA
jgi:hypothetical protein